MRVIVIASGYNCAKYVHPCMGSVLGQQHSKWLGVFISDGSTDETAKRIRDFQETDPRIIKEIGIGNHGAAFRRWNAIKKYATRPDDIVALLGLDDELFPHSLERVVAAHEKGALVTYGNWVNQRGRGLPSKFNLDFDAKTHAERSYRQQKFRTTALNTFRRSLFDHFTPTDFQLDGKWIQATTESHLMISCLEMAGKDRIAIIKEPIYKYNMRSDGARRRMGDQYQQRVYTAMMAKPKKPLLP